MANYQDIPTYWGEKGRLQREYDLLYAKYLDSAKFLHTHKTSETKANIALRQLASINHKYYRLYNDGDAFTHNGVYYPTSTTDDNAEKLELAVDEIIMACWVYTNFGTLDVVERVVSAEASA